MSRSTTPTSDRRTPRAVGVVATVAWAIPEDSFHRAVAAATAHTNTSAGETFILAGATYVRVNDRHFRIDAACGHACALAIVGRSAVWRHPERLR